MNLAFFKNTNLFEACELFFEQLEIGFTKTSKQSISLHNLLAGNINTSDEFLQSIEEAYFLGFIEANLQPKESQENEIEKVGKYAKMMLFAVSSSLSNPTKTNIAKLTRAFNRKSVDTPVVLITKYVKDQTPFISFSTTERLDYKVKNKVGEKIGKVTLIKDINTEKPHRGHLEILKNMKAKQDSKKISSFEELYTRWLEVFDLNILNRKFYREVAEWYLWASKEVCFPQIRPASKQNEMIENTIYQQESVLRMFTRLLFCWFMKEMQLIPEQAFDEQSMMANVKDFGQGNNYYKAILQNLFFATLSVKMNERKFVKKHENNFRSKDFGNQYVYRYYDQVQNPEFIQELFENVPFLNGGLFECLDKVERDENQRVMASTEVRIDGFSQTQYKQAQVPDKVFFGQDDNAQGIIKIFEKYKFTIAENTPLEEEVALDPEMLGKVFENLLAYHNPETGETVRKSTGSFYTPRQIVDYMVEESLIACLVNADKLSAFANLEERLRTLFSYYQSQNPFSDQESMLLIEAIYALRILDPACGSGAFPMGVLQKLVFVLNKLDEKNDFIKQILKKGKKNELDQKAVEIAKNYLPKRQELKKNKEIIQAITIEEIKEKNIKEIDKMIADLERAYWQEIDELEKSFDPNENEKDYGKKLYLIQDCIYGIDIQTIAIHISKLRFFLSLLIEQKKDTQSKEHNYGIIPLPNLDTKLIAANTLLAPEKDAMHSTLFDEQIKEKKEKLHALRKEHIFISEQDRKKKAQKDDQTLQQQIADLLWQTYDSKKQFKNSQQISDYISQVEAQIQAIQEQIKKKEENLKTAHKDLKKAINSQLSKLKQEIQQITKDTALHRWKKQLPTFIDIEKAAGYIPYDQNKSAPFFDPEWMFGITTGFDILIGNPPYIQLQKDGGKLAKLYEKLNFQTFERTGDIYSLFYEKGIQLLKNNGILTYITSNKWMRAGYGKTTRAFFCQHNPLKLIDLGSGVFESATVDTNILLIQKTAQKPTHYHLKALDLAKEKNITSFQQFAHRWTTLTQLSDDSWTIASDIEQGIKQKIEQKGTPLKNWDIQINYGIKTGYNEAFIIDGKKKDQLIAQDPTSAEIIKPILRGRDIKRYKAEFADLWLIATFPALKLNIDDYPAVKAYLQSFGKRLHQTGEEFIDENGQKAKARKKTGNKWFETQDQIAYYQEFEKEKIVWNRIASIKEFSLVEKGTLIQDSMHFIVGKNLYFIIGILNSSLFSWLLNLIVGTAAGGNAGNADNVKNIPIPKLSESEQLPFVRLVEQIIAGKEQGKDTTELEAQIDRLVYELYGLTEEEIKIVEGGK